jgi:hypothetical protein
MSLFVPPGAGGQPEATEALQKRAWVSRMAALEGAPQMEERRGVRRLCRCGPVPGPATPPFRLALI